MFDNEKKNKNRQSIMYQFAHVESYSLTAPKSSKAGKNHSVKSIVDEALRHDGAIPHIDNPQVPIQRYGKPLEELEANCAIWSNSLKDARGHKMRKDALCLLAGVISAPSDMTPEAWQAFSTDAIEALKQKYGDQLETVIEHADESHPHLHFYVIPKLGERFETVHEGRAASQAAKANGELKGRQNAAYKEAMRGFQDEFYNKVGIAHGFTRIGPRKRRLTREEWKLEQIQALAAARAIEEANARVEASKTMAVELRQKAEEEIVELKNNARSEIFEIGQKSIRESEIAKQKAVEKGFNSGLDSVEKMPFLRKIYKVMLRAVAERDELRGKVSLLEEKIKKLMVWEGRARRLLGFKKKYEKLEPMFDEVKKEASKVPGLEAKNRKLSDELQHKSAILEKTEILLSEANKKLEPEKPTQVRKRAVEDYNP